MNRQRIAIAAIAGCLGLCALIVFSGRMQPRDTLAKSEVDHKRSLAPAQVSVGAPQQSTPVTRVSMATALSTPISFYGKVVDQSGMAVTNAAVRAEANDNAAGAPTVNTLKSDAAGFFEIKGMHGIQLAVSVSKEGYYQVHNTPSKIGSAAGFRYYDLGSGGVHVPDKEKPVVFTLFKQGNVEMLERIHSNSVGLRSEGQAVIVNVTPSGATIRRKIAIRAWSSGQTGQNSQPYDWRVEIEPYEGGICPSRGDFEFEAPETGYQSFASIDMPASLPSSQWHDGIKAEFFLRFDDGVFARIEVNLAAPPHGSAFITGFLNPKTGSRNLEKDPSVH